MQDPKKRTIYTNRILDGGDVPIVSITKYFYKKNN